MPNEASRKYSVGEARNLSLPVAYMRGVFDRIVTEYRAPRTEPRGGAWYEDPAPGWVVILSRAVIERVGHTQELGEAVLRRVLRWCEDGETPRDRARELLELLTNTTGPRLPALVSFLEEKGAPNVDGIIRTQRLRLGDDGKLERWDGAKGVKLAWTIPELLELVGFRAEQVADARGRALTIEVRLGPKVMGAPRGNVGPAESSTIRVALVTPERTMIETPDGKRVELAPGETFELGGEAESVCSGGGSI